MPHLSVRLLWVLLVAACVSATYAALNIYAIRQVNPTNEYCNSASLRGGVLVNSVDDEYYVNPPENMLAGKGGRRTTIGRAGYARRTPGYSLWYLPYRMAFGPHRVFAALAVGQWLLFLASVAALFGAVQRLPLLPAVRWGVLAVYIGAPFFSSYALYTITESISVALLVVYLGCLTKAYYADDPRIKLRSYVMAAFFCTAALLTRPLSGLAALAFPVFLYFDYHQKQGIGSYLRHGLQVALLPVLMLSTWTVRNYLVTGYPVVLERYMHPEAHDMYKPSFIALWDLYGTAGTNQADLYAIMFPLYYAAVQQGRNDAPLRQQLVRLMPAPYRQAVGAARLDRQPVPRLVGAGLPPVFFAQAPGVAQPLPSGRAAIGRYVWPDAPPATGGLSQGAHCRAAAGAAREHRAFQHVQQRLPSAAIPRLAPPGQRLALAHAGAAPGLVRGVFRGAFAAGDGPPVGGEVAVAGGFGWAAAAVAAGAGARNWHY